MHQAPTENQADTAEIKVDLAAPPTPAWGDRASSALLRVGTSIHLARSEPMHNVEPFHVLRPLPFLAPPWSQGSGVAAGHIRQGNLEVMQWLAFVAMVLDHIGFLMPHWGLGESSILRGIGRISYPMFAFVFAWRVSHALWRSPRHDFTGMGFRLFCCALAAHIAWAATGIETPVNIVVGFAGTLGIVLLLQEDRGWTVPLGLRLSAAAAIGYWITLNVDFGMQGLALTLGAYAYLRWNDTGARNTALAALFVLTAGFPVHTAVLALPVVFLIHNSSLSLKKPFAGLFYVLYPLHVAVLAVITVMVFG